MTNTLKVTEFPAAVRGYHYYGCIWFPEKEEQLDCSHDFGKVFDVFTIDTCKPESTVVGHFPREISRATKFLWDRGAQISAILTSTNYRRSPLVQGGLEIVILGSFLKNRLLQPNQQTKREIHRTLTIQRKNRSQITT